MVNDMSAKDTIEKNSLRNNTLDLTQGNVTRRLLTFAIPVFLGNLFQLFYSLALFLFNFPVPVTLKRFAAALLVFIFGITDFLLYTIIIYFN